ncbi:MAG: gliding motility-associated ABC transporter permease subunit GldF [Bacteroidetes bacterium GWF2_38_335]|nr:MAG: gliding motility-associated ABC transporter permease subunit GldF [Bacteroidetes bacterium GWF2_38_335]OFY80960.1 MAG: gliding motility-associated ABC transporter permease subunit GldF [Bacteroidetes bacterium RIFOXYA12_FULL_38_20]HBS85103.1 gliding motility-associated ABC transporter permease subunit GldF [Bacteroidales bacterium]
MYTLFLKEIRSFLNSLTGYIAIVVFLLLNSFFIWILPGEMNILDGGIASLDTLFLMAPWFFLILIPAITMRLFAEEKRSGTIELLFTRPISDLKIIMAKYLAGLTLVVIALLPTLIFYYSIYMLGEPVGSLDSGGTWGSYIGLFFLAAVYVAIGVFCSSITDNQIVSLIISIILSFFFYYGFDAMSSIIGNYEVQEFIMGLGINDHYFSISRGVIDSRDMIYFISVIGLFIVFTKLVLESRKW